MNKLLRKDASSLSISELEKLIDYLNKEYRAGDEKVEDSRYDDYIKILKKKKPDSRFLREIGAPVRDELVKVKLPLWMGSMDNSIYPDTKPLARWKKKYPGPYFLSGKLDGASALYGNEVLYTRGDGKIGQDISYLLEFLKLPRVEDGIYVRGELIMEKETFEEKWEDDFPKARSAVVGTINSKKPNTKILSDVHFVAFELIDKRTMTPSEQMRELDKLGFSVPYNKKVDDVDVEELMHLFQKFKERSHYEIDGIIIADDHHHRRNVKGNPDYAIAFKVNAEGVKTTIEEVIWEPSMFGVLIPSIKFHTVQIGGDNVSYATAFNAKYVKEHRLRKGKEIKIVKSGDVIPYISEILETPEHISGRKADFPNHDDWEWNSTEVDIVLIHPEDNLTVRTKRLLHFFTSFEIKYINIGIVKKFMEHELDTPPKIYNATVEDFLEIDGIKEKSAHKYHKSIHDALDKPQSLERIMKSSLAFGSGFGERKLYPLVNTIKMVWFEDGELKFRKPHLDEIMNIEGFAFKTALQFMDGFSRFLKFMKRNKYLKIDEGEKEIEDGELEDYYILFTGVRDKDLSEKLKKSGAHIEKSYTKKTNLLVVKNMTASNSKVEKAKKEGIKIITLEEVEKFIEDNS
jgi:DNA ligase (NAD+)